MIEKKEMVCPKCGKVFVGYPAVSRKDNKTEICSLCGIKEALEAFEKDEKSKKK